MAALHVNGCGGNRRFDAVAMKFIRVLRPQPAPKPSQSQTTEIKSLQLPTTLLAIQLIALLTAPTQQEAIS